MYKFKLFLLFIIKIIIFQQIASAAIKETARNKWQNDKLSDFTSIILNEQLVRALNDQQQLTNVQSLYKEAISRIYDQIPLQDLVEQLWKIYKNYDVQSFITMTRAQLALFWRYNLDKIEDPYYVLLATHCFHKIKHDVFFTRLNEYTQQLVNISIKNTPLSLQYLFGNLEFCLCNYNCNEFIYQISDNKTNGKISQISILPWNKYNNMGNLQAIFKESEEDQLADLYLALVTKHKQSYFHIMDNHNHMIGANNTQSKLENFLWSVELVDDNQLVFEQDEYLMCQNGSVVYASKQKTIYDKECQWSVTDCNDKV